MTMSKCKSILVPVDISEFKTARPAVDRAVVLGSNVATIVRHAKCSVLVVR